MESQAVVPRVLSACLVTVLAACAAPQAEEPLRWSFADPAPGTLPPEWEPAETNGAGTPGVWRVEQDAMRLASTPNRGQTYNLLLAREVEVRDLELAVRLRADSGREDQGGGLVWRARDASNYYIARWNPLEDNLRVYKVEGGKRTMLASADVDADPAAFHTLRVTMLGSAITVALDGRELLRHADLTFPGPGRIGLWTKADAAVTFDDLEVRRR